VELDKDLCKQSAARILKLGLEKNARIINGDLLKQNYSSADVVTVYLLPDAVNNKVQPLLDKQLKRAPASWPRISTSAIGPRRKWRTSRTTVKAGVTRCTCIENNPCFSSRKSPGRAPSPGPGQRWRR